MAARRALLAFPFYFDALQRVLHRVRLAAALHAPAGAEGGDVALEQCRPHADKV